MGPRLVVTSSVFVVVGTVGAVVGPTVLVAIGSEVVGASSVFVVVVTG